MKYGILALTALSGAAFAGMSNTANYYGNVGALMVGDAYPAASSGGGTFFVSGMPATATVVSAFVHSNDWFNGGAAHDFDFNGNVFAPQLASDSSPSSFGDVYDYRWDVTSYVTGNGAYPYRFAGGSQIYGFALTVVYKDASLAAGSVHVYEGAEHVGEGHTTDSYTINFLNAAAGPAYMWLFTQADDTNTSGETLVYNGNTVGGPIDDNLGPFASIFYTPVVNNGVSEQLDINTYGDWFGLHAAVLTTSIPAPGALALVGLGGLVAGRRRR